jgi:hypothetical protein
MRSFGGLFLIGLMGVLFGLVTELRRLEQEKSLNVLITAITESKKVAQIQLS